MRAAAFLSGGFLPTELRGTSSNLAIAISDWYPTFCALAGIDPSDRNGTEPYPNIDGVNLLPMLAEPAKFNSGGAHKYLWVSSQVLIKGDYKLIVAQPKRTLFGAQVQKSGYSPKNAWKHPDGLNWVDVSDMHHVYGVTSAGGSRCSQPEGDTPSPCLFNVASDPAEVIDLADVKAYAPLLKEMWQELKDQNSRSFTAKSPPELLGDCNLKCANDHWHTLGSPGGPYCGLGACVNATADDETPSWAAPNGSSSPSSDAPNASSSAAARPHVTAPPHADEQTAQWFAPRPDEPPSASPTTVLPALYPSPIASRSRREGALVP